MSQRLDWLDFARGASILLVVMFHASITLEEQGSVSPLYWFSNNFFGPIRMPVFFLISGFLARSVIQRGWRDLLSQRLALLAYVFTVWTVIHFGFDALVTPGDDAGLARLLTSIHSPSSVLWFIWALAFYVVVAKAGASTNAAAVMTASVLLSIVVHSGLVEFESYVHANVFKFMPFFLFGAWYSSSVIRSELFGRRPYVVLSSIAYAVLFIVVYEELAPLGLIGPMSFLLGILGINFGICASVVACRSAALSAVPLHLGRNTLAIYVAHYPIVQVLALAPLLTDGAVWLEQVWAVPVVAAVATMLSLLLKAAADRFGAGWLYEPPTLARRPSRDVGNQNV
jgi:uncharacterized membrane protein YcfT